MSAFPMNLCPFTEQSSDGVAEDLMYLEID